MRRVWYRFQFFNCKGSKKLSNIEYLVAPLWNRATQLLVHQSAFQLDSPGPLQLKYSIGTLEFDPMSGLKEYSFADA